MNAIDYQRRRYVLNWLLKTIFYSVLVFLFFDTVASIINQYKPFGRYFPTSKKYILDATITALFVVQSIIRLMYGLEKRDNRRKEIELKNNAHIMKNGKPIELQRLELRRMDPLDYLIDQSFRYSVACINESYDKLVDWDYLKGGNKDKFEKKIQTISELEPEKYQQSILYVWDRLLQEYNRIVDITSKLDQRERLYCSLLSIEQGLYNYLAIAYFHSVFKDPEYCYRSILNKLGKEVRENNGNSLIHRSADYCGISEKLMLRYRNEQCSKCQVRGCIDRVTDKHGILELVGPNLDDLVLGKEHQDYRDEVESINYVKFSGEKEIDAIFHIMLEEKPTYTEAQFYMDYFSFREKCRIKARAKDAEKENTAWIVSILNVLAESFYNFAFTDKQIYAEYARQYIVAIEAEFMEAPYQICVRDLCVKLDMYERILNETHDAPLINDEDYHEKDSGYLPITWELHLLYKSLGPMIPYEEKRMCEACKNTSCKYRNHFKKYICDYDRENVGPENSESDSLTVSFGDITEVPKIFRSSAAIEIWEKAYKAGLIDEHFKFKGTQVELSLFAGNLSVELFGKIDWVKVNKWDGYKYFPQKYAEVSGKSREKLSARGKVIYDLFH